MTAVSVLVTCYQQARFVEEALDSVAAQTFTDWELIVTDDGSTDGSADLIRGWDKRHGGSADLLLSGTNHGLTKTLNAALPHCNGEYLAYLGGDDIWAPTKLEALVTALEARPDAAVAYSDARLVDADGRLTAPSFLDEHGHRPAPEGRVFTDLLRRNFVIASSAVYRRAAIEAVGAWDAALPFEDWDLLLHLADRHQFVHVPDALVDYRVHDESTTRSRFSHMIEGRLMVLEKWLHRNQAHDAMILPVLRSQSWRFFKVHADRGRPRVAVAYRDARDLRGRLRHLVATRPPVEAVFEALRRARRVVRRPFRRPPP